MATGNQQILKEYLLSLGFKIDTTSTNKFDFALGKFNTSVGGLAAKVVGVTTATLAMVSVFANSMEKLYYASKRTGSTIGNIQALEYGAKQVGVSGETMRASLEAMARALRSNPGLQGLLHDLGVKVEGRDRADVLVDMVKQLKQMPFYVAQQYASLFGIDGDTLLMLQDGVGELEKARDLRKQMASDVGVDLDAAGKAGKEYSNMLRETYERVGLLKDALAIALLEPTKAAAKAANELLTAWTKIVGMKYSGDDNIFKRFLDGLAGMAGGSAGGARVRLSKDSRERIAAGVLGSDAVVGQSSQELFGRLEKKHNLPDGILDRMWAKESGRGKNMLSPAGAQGHFQFLPSTGQELGLKNPFDLAESAQKAAEYLAMLMNRYGGDIQKALAAYNWGMGNVDRKGLAAAPWETRDYVTTLSGRPFTIQQTTNITVTSNDPMAAGRAVAREQEKVNSNIVRNQWGVLDTP